MFCNLVQIYHLYINSNNNQDYLGVTIWPGKTDPSAEVITLQLRRNEGDNWETIGRLAVYRAPDGSYSKLPERQQ
jgi:hypothetical protein